jgi:hypothetical protein
LTLHFRNGGTRTNPARGRLIGGTGEKRIFLEPAIWFA